MNISKLLNDLLEGVVFYAYEHARAIYIATRFPVRGPRYLAYRNVRHPEHTVGPHAFLLINLVIVFFFIEIIAPLIFMDLKVVALTLGSQLEKVANSEINWMPMVLRSLVILVSADVVLRLASLTVPTRDHPRDHREIVRNSFLFSLGLQPLAVVAALIYVTQCHLLNDAFIELSTLAILAVIALPTVILVARSLSPSLTSRLYGAIAKGITSVLTALLIVGLYAEAVILIWWEVGDPPDKLTLIKPVCKADGEGNAQVSVVVENRTKKRFILSADSAVLTFFEGNQLKPSSMETSLGRDLPFLIVQDGALFWIKLKGRISSKVTVNQDCLVWINDEGFIIGEEKTHWQNAPYLPP